MDSAEIFKRYDAIIGGKFKRDAILVDGKQSADEPDNLLNKDDKQKGPPVKVGVSSSRQEKTKDELDISQTTQWIPEVKRLVQFRDLRNQIQVLPAEKSSGRKRRIEKDIDHPWRGYAIILRRVLGADLSLREYRLELQSRSLCKIFKEIGRLYEELNLDTTPIVIKHPFLCLFHLRDQLKALKDSTNTDTATKQGLSELLSFISMEPALKRIIEPYEELVPKGKIRRNLHWTLIRPHEFVYRRFGTGPETKHVYEECAFVTEVEEMFFVGPGSSYTHILHGVVTRHNGPTSGLTRCSWPFGSVSDAIVNITAKDLDCVPMRLLPREEQNDIRQRLIARGRRYFDLSSASHTFMKYDGPIILDPGENARRLGEIMGSRNIFNAHGVASQRVMIHRKAESEVRFFRCH
ncbi:hypothetical protein LY78DRAFT_18273 [Colletotrichum sublineola]|nr:hypothetical protein LY78DRAFT_18273 [Colletotrichum sublineola]